MNYQKAPSFQKGFRALPSARQQRVEQALRKLAVAMELGEISAGLGLKRLRYDFWEIRAGLFDRIVFQRRHDAVVFLVVGTHDDIKRFLKAL